MNKKIIYALFKDKTTIILREMLAHPDRKWTVRDLVDKCGVSLGLASRTISFLDRLGVVERVRKGRRGYTKLIKKEVLIDKWFSAYDFSLNKIRSFYSPRRDILKRIKGFLAKKGLGDSYALTLHTGSNLLTNYVLTDEVYLYLDKDIFDRYIKEICDHLGIKKLVEGGNLHFIIPYYKKSVFYRSRILNGYRLVSNLQLYLDLYDFIPRGRQHAEYLVRILKPEEIFT